VSASNGSTLGGATLSIDGQYFFSNELYPADIKVGGNTLLKKLLKLYLNVIKLYLNVLKLKLNLDQPCEVIGFDLGNTVDTKLTCKTPPVPTLQSEYPGGRGINFIRDRVLTSFSNLLTSTPSQNARYSIFESLSFKDDESSDITVWFKGFFVVGKDSDYQFELVTNGDAILVLSTDSTSANKVIFFFIFSKFKYY
jgi:hypothetical protein